MRAKKRFRVRDVRLLATSITVGAILAVGFVSRLSTSQDTAPVAAHSIQTEHATATWEAPLVASPELEVALARVALRLRIDHAATAWVGASESSSALEAAAAQVEPRIRLGGAATSSLDALEDSPELAGSLANVSPRLLFEHAATSALLGPLSANVAGEVDANDRILIEHAATSVVESPTPPPGWVAPPAPTAVKPATTPAPAAATPTTSAPTTPAPSTTKPTTASTQPTTTKPATTAARPSAPVKPAPTPRHSSLWWVWLLCGAAVVALAALGVRAYRRRDKVRPIGDSAPTAQQPAPATVVAASPAPSPAKAPAAPRLAAHQDRARPNASALSRRSPAAVFLLPFVTFGIYALYWLVRTKTELNAAGAKIPTAILLIVPIANLYWLWKFGEGVDYVTDRRMSTGVAFLLVLFLDIIGSAIIQSQLNNIER